MPSLFEPFSLKGVTLRNRIGVSPMCQYAATDGVPNEWHYSHIAGLARGGAGLVNVEATAVSPEGRITPGCTGLWKDEQAEAYLPFVRMIEAAGAVAGIQLAHAGRKASINLPWEGDDHIPEGDPRGWETIAPSPIAIGGKLHRVPKMMTKKDIHRVQRDFVAAAIRARDIGFRWLNLHFAHGYLAQSFFSKHSNQRQDEYGGTAENRSRFLIETLDAVREVWPEDRPLTARFGVVEFDSDDDSTLSESIELIGRFKKHGLDFIDVSVGFTSPRAKIPFDRPGFMEPYVGIIRREAGLPVSTGWNLHDPALADRLVRDAQLDIVMIGKALLADPHWPYLAAKALNIHQPSTVLPQNYGYWLRRSVSEIYL